jgi:hypothetical protein
MDSAQPSEAAKPDSTRVTKVRYRKPWQKSLVPIDQFLLVSMGFAQAHTFGFKEIAGSKFHKVRLTHLKLKNLTLLKK